MGLLCACQRPRRIRVPGHLLVLWHFRGFSTVFFVFFFRDAFFGFINIFCVLGVFGL